MAKFSLQWRKKLFVVNNFVKWKCVYVLSIALKHARTKLEKGVNCCIRSYAVL
jgi:hypothetical protein